MATADIVSNFTDGSVVIDDDNSNSATLAKFTGTLSISGLLPDGRQASLSEAQGAVTGLRKGARAFYQISFEGQLADFDHAFHRQAMGVTAGFTSTTADIGDYASNDLTFNADYSTDTREIIADDCYVTEFSISQGDPVSTVSFTVQGIGPLTIDGTTYVSSR